MHSEATFSTRFRSTVPFLVLALLTPACGGALSRSADDPVDAGEGHTARPGEDAGADARVTSTSSPDTGVTRTDASGTSKPAEDASPSDAPSHRTPARPSFPQVPTGGRTLTRPRLVTIVASNDVPSDGSDTAVMLQGFSDVLPSSKVWAAVASEYGLTSLSSAAHLTGPAITAGSYSTDQVEAYVAGVISGATGSDAGVTTHAALSPDGRTVYVLYLPSGASLANGYCASHAAYPLATGAGDEVVVMARCAPEHVTENQLGELTRNATSAIIDAITDPLDEGYMLPPPPAEAWSGNVWNAGGDVYLGSLCAGTRVFETTRGGPPGGWELSRIWSNTAAAAGGDPCVPEHDEPYYTVTTPKGWYSVQPGGTVSIPVTGWSAGPTSSWLLSPYHVADTNDPSALYGVADGGIASNSEAGAGTTGRCYVRAAMNDGVGGTVDVTMPGTAQRGDYLVVGIHSFREDPASCEPPITGDLFHIWPVGVYVP